MDITDYMGTGIISKRIKRVSGSNSYPQEFQVLQSTASPAILLILKALHVCTQTFLVLAIRKQNYQKLDHKMAS